MQNQEEEFDKLTEEDGADNSYRAPAKVCGLYYFVHRFLMFLSFVDDENGC